MTNQAFLNTYLYATISKYTVSGVETVLTTTENSTVITGSATGLDMFATINDTVLNATDRLIARVYINCGGNHPNITLFWDGIGTDQTNSRIQTPAAGVDVSMYLPYINAVQNLNMGAHNITTSGLTLTGIPTTSSGLSTGQIYSVSGVLHIV
jgi:hypothetical protein